MVKLVCPICQLQSTKIFCRKCVLNGLIVHDPTYSKDQHTYADKTRKIELKKIQISNLNEQIQTKYKSEISQINISEKLVVTQESINDLRQAIISKQKLIKEKTERHKDLRTELKLLKEQCRYEGDRIKGITRMCMTNKDHIKSYTKKVVLFESKVSLVKKQLRHDLFSNVFPVHCADEFNSADKDRVCGVVLSLNSSDRFASPEPSTSSQVALQNLVLVVRTLACIEDVWLPAASKRALSLPRSFTVTHVIRDDLHRIYQVLGRCTHILCASQQASHLCTKDPLTALVTLVKHCSKALDSISKTSLQTISYEIPEAALFDANVTVELECVDETWNSPLGSAGNPDWVEIPNDIPYDPGVDQLLFQGPSALSSFIETTKSFIWGASADPNRSDKI